MAGEVTLSVITASRNRPDSLARLKASLASDVPTEHLVMSEIQTPAPGATAALRLGFPRCQGQYVMLLADDLEVYPDTLKTAVDFMDAHPDVGQGILYVGTGAHGCHIPTYHGLIYGQYWIVRREVGNLVDWYDPACKHAGVDPDLSCKILEAGYGIVAIPGACVKDHDVRDTTHRESTNQAQQDVERINAKWVGQRMDRLKRTWEEKWKALSGPEECGRHGCR